MLIVLFLVEFSNRKTLFLLSLCFLCQLYNSRGYYFQYVVSNFCLEDHKLKVCVHRGTDFDSLTCYNLGIFQVLLGAQSLYDFKIY